jgi:hypothetical protein
MICHHMFDDVYMFFDDGYMFICVDDVDMLFDDFYKFSDFRHILVSVSCFLIPCF